MAGAAGLGVVVPVDFTYDDQALKQAADALKTFGDQVSASAAKTGIFSEAQSVSRREVRLATAETLRMVGVTGEAGIVGRLAATGFMAMGSAAEYANLAIVGATFGLSLIIPSLLKMIGLSGETADNTKKVGQSAQDQLTSLEEYRAKLGQVDVALDAHIRRLREEASYDQKKEIKDVAKQLADQLLIVQAASDKYENLKTNIQENELTGKKWTDMLADAAEELQVAQDQAVDYTEKLDRLTKAEAAHTTVVEQDAQRVKEATEARKQAAAEVAAEVEADKKRLDLTLKTADAIEKDEEWLRKFNDTGQDMIDTEARKADATRKSEEHQRFYRGQSLSEYLRMFKEEDTAESRSLLRRLEWARKTAAERRQIEESLVSQGLGAAQALFGKHKALMIAQAIADTYAGADKALADETLPSWASLAMAAIVIAQGLANVEQIRKTSAGFDNPMSDAIAREFGTRWASDLIYQIGGGFNRALGEATAAPAASSIQHTTINRGTTIQQFHAHGYWGTSKAAVMRKLKRDLIVQDRAEGRSSLT